MIKLVAFDCDGTLTDGRIIISESGEIKSFHAADGQGIANLKKHGIKLAMISGRTSLPTSIRCKELGFDYCSQGIDNKLLEIQKIWKLENCSPEQTAYMGDDIADIPVLKSVGLSGAPIDGHKSVVKKVDWVSTLPAGRGAAREFCDLICEKEKFVQK